MLVRDILLGPFGSHRFACGPIREKLSALASEESTGTQLWQSDGTAAGTRPAAAIRPDRRSDARRLPCK